MRCALREAALVKYSASKLHYGTPGNAFAAGDSGRRWAAARQGQIMVTNCMLSSLQQPSVTTHAQIK